MLFEPHAIRIFGDSQGENPKLCHKRIEREGGEEERKNRKLVGNVEEIESQTGLGVGSWSQDLYLAMGK